MNICSAGGWRIKDKGINRGCERPKGAKEGSQKWGEHPLPHPTMSKQQQLPGIGDTCLLGKTLQVCASDKVGLRFQGVSKRRGVPRKKERREKTREVTAHNQRSNHLLHLANTSTFEEPPTHRRILLDG